MKSLLMVYTFIALLAISSIEARDRNSALDNDWNQFKKKCSKNYNKTEENDRRIKWEDNMQKIKQHNNKREITFQLEANEFADLTNEEFNKIYNRLKVSTIKRRSISAEKYVLSRAAIPTSKNWVTSGAVTPIKDQGPCGSCWAFATTAAVESAYYLSKRKLVDLSEQNVLDCSSNPKYGSLGCAGGFVHAAFQYMIDNKGIDTESFYPYKAIQQTCKFNSKYVGGTISSYQYYFFPSGNEAALTEAVALKGPIVVGIHAAPLHLYKSGIITKADCSASRINHAVLVVGYGVDAVSGKAYYLVKNSWGTNWGENGYFRIARNENNLCGIATLITYPVV